MKKIITIMVTSALFACSANTTDTTVPTTKIIVDTGDKYPAADTEFFSHTDIVPLETNDSSLLADISKIMFEDDFMAIADYRGNQICLFDYEGRHIRTIRHIGRGPKEYISLSEATLDRENKRFIIFDDKTYKLKFYTYDGTWAGDKEYKLLVHNMTVADGKLYLLNSPSMNNKKYVTELPLNEDSQPVPLFNFTRPQNCSLYPSGSRISNCGRNVLLSQRFDYTIYEIADDKVLPKYTVDFGAADCRSIVDELEDEKLEDALIKNRNLVYGITDMMETDKLLIFKTNLSGTVVYDKQSGQTRYCATIKVGGIPVSTSSTATTENNTDKVVSILDTESLLR
ncbi:MAG: 6-bladed beta-propeller, partial [Ruminococcus flavefaciens]|nr:6-bladed beta-propeller [Ruminococcus flavefaciens]